LTGRSLAAAFLLTIVSVGCSPTTNPVRDVFADFGAGPPKPEAPDFVAQTRPAQLDYIPVGRAAAAPKAAARTPEEIAKLEDELEAARARNEAQGAAARRAGATPAATIRRTP
jgi:hypothetical protein